MPFVESYAQTVLTNVIKSTTQIGLLDSNGNELSGNGYQRHAIGNLDTSKPGQIANSEIIFMFESTGAIGTATQFALFNGSTKIFVGDLTTSLSINGEGYVPLVRAHELIIGLDVSSIDSNY